MEENGLTSGHKGVYMGAQLFSVIGMAGSAIATIVFLFNGFDGEGTSFTEAWLGLLCGALAFSVCYGIHSFTSDKLGYSLLKKISDALDT